MTYEIFKTAIIQSLKETFNENTTISIHSVLKNNHVVLDGLTIQEQGINISPTIYLEYYYEEYLHGKSIKDIHNSLIEVYEKNRSKENLDLSFFTDYQKVQHHIIYKLIHYEKNRELLRKVPHFPYLDFAVVFCCLLLDTPTGNASILIQNHHLDLWNITPNDLYTLAHKNTPILLPGEVISMEELLNSFVTIEQLFSLDEFDFKENCPMYVLTNKSRLFGASCILYPDILAEFANKLNSDLYILPSSIHEVILLPENYTDDISTLNEMIQDANSTQVLDEEILSDHAYLYSRTDGLMIL